MPSCLNFSGASRSSAVEFRAHDPKVVGSNINTTRSIVNIQQYLHPVNLCTLLKVNKLEPRVTDRHRTWKVDYFFKVGRRNTHSIPEHFKQMDIYTNNPRCVINLSTELYYYCLESFLLTFFFFFQIKKKKPQGVRFRPAWENYHIIFIKL